MLNHLKLKRIRSIRKTRDESEILAANLSHPSQKRSWSFQHCFAFVEYFIHLLMRLNTRPFCGDGRCLCCFQREDTFNSAEVRIVCAGATIFLEFTTTRNSEQMIRCETSKTHFSFCNECCASCSDFLKEAQPTKSDLL